MPTLLTHTLCLQALNVVQPPAPCFAFVWALLLAKLTLFTHTLCAQVFIVDQKSSKKQIKDAVSTLYDIQTKKINTLVRCVGLLWPAYSRQMLEAVSRSVSLIIALVHS